MNIGGSHTKFLAAALRGLEAQRQAAEHNIANIETPGFQARKVSFESSLQAAMSSGDPRGASISTSHSNAPTRIDGSNVDLEQEVTSLELNALQQQLINQALNSKYRRLRTSIGS